jgi:hypothetical protein
MHSVFIYILFNKDLPRSYITKFEATTQHIQTREWVKEHAIMSLCPKNINNAPLAKYRAHHVGIHSKENKNFPPQERITSQELI